VDLDPELLEIAKEWVTPLGLGTFKFFRGNALLTEDYPEGPFDFVVSAGLGEFSRLMKLRSSTGMYMAFPLPAASFTRVPRATKSAAKPSSRTSSC
jgi:hypothetical protein